MVLTCLTAVPFLSTVQGITILDFQELMKAKASGYLMFPSNTLVDGMQHVVTN